VDARADLDAVMADWTTAASFTQSDGRRIEQVGPTVTVPDAGAREVDQEDER